MHSVGCGAVKKIGELEVGEIIIFSGGGQNCTGVCLGQAEGKTSIGILLCDKYAGKVIQLSGMLACQSHGRDWVLDLRASQCEAPKLQTHKGYPAVLVDANRIIIAFTDADFGEPVYFDVKSSQVVSGYPDKCIEITEFAIWRDADAMRDPGNKPLVAQKDVASRQE